ncbi:hypothetical protein AB0B25_15460 [Nocardia sp. NPDC049190]|uniref:hypothetical protein n=1 Tax=Nocardia sp. NPDC049190 TaxID=3155650 RepID=UPI0034012767
MQAISRFRLQCTHGRADVALQQRRTPPAEWLGEPVEATYFGNAFSGSASTCCSSGAFGQWAAKISYVPRPSR